MIAQTFSTKNKIIETAGFCKCHYLFASEFAISQEIYKYSTQPPSKLRNDPKQNNKAIAISYLTLHWRNYFQ